MPGLIFTGDLQADWSNLERCEKVVDEICAFVKKNRIAGVVFLGDMKERYNPVDVRVVNFVTNTIAEIRNRNAQVYVLLGNHDRVGMRSHNESWLPTLSHAGAACFVDPTTVNLGRFALYMLPFRERREAVIEGAQKLARLRERANGDASEHILCFHQGLKEANYRGGVSSRDVLSVDDLLPEKYDRVLGGHLHLHQVVKYKHVMYVGSPFATTWGEANEKKGFIHLR